MAFGKGKEKVTVTSEEVEQLKSALEAQQETLEELRKSNLEKEKKEEKKTVKEPIVPDPPGEKENILVVKEIPTEEVRLAAGEDGTLYTLETPEEALTKIRKALEDIKRFLN